MSKHTPTRLELVAPSIIVDSMSAIDAENFVVTFLGVPHSRIDHTEDGGPVDRPGRYKPGARAWHVFLKPTGGNHE